MTTTSPDDLWSVLDPELPVALLPVRVETRFGTRPSAIADGSATEQPVLRVRIYPDEVSIAPDDPGLTANELAAAAGFWTTPDAPAWEALVRTLGLERAVLAARATRDGVPTTSADGASSAPTTHLQPDSWVIVGYRDDVQVLSAHIPTAVPDLPTGPARGRDDQAFVPAEPTLLAPDDPLRWLVDFDRAVEVGMAAVIDIDPVVAANGLSALIVIGIRAPSPERSSTDEAESLAQLLSVHAARDRLGVVPVGTPTNNVGERHAGWSTTPDPFDVYRRLMSTGSDESERAEALRGGARNATALATAFAVPVSLFDSVPGGDDRHSWWSRQMMRALFPVTLGETLTVLARPAYVEQADEREYAAFVGALESTVPFARDHVTGYLRARGPLPTLRVGRQPYGVLPMLPLRRFTAQQGEPEQLDALAGILSGLRPFWERAAERLPILDARRTETDDAATRLVSLLGQGPVPHPGRYLVTQVTGPVATFLQDLERDAAELAALGPVDNVLETELIQRLVTSRFRADAYRALITSAIAKIPRGSIAGVVRAGGADVLRLPIATTDTRRPLASPAGYLHAIAEAGLSFDSATSLADPPKDLLFQLARRSVELAGELDAFDLLWRHAKQLAIPVLTTSSEVSSSPLQAGVTATRMLHTSLSEAHVDSDLSLPAKVAGMDAGSIVATIAHDVSIRDAIFELHPELPATYLDGYPGTKAALTALADANLSDEEYTRLVGETLACHANRLDAWCTSLATRRLDLLRARRPEGLQIGAWGVLLDLMPDNRTDEAPEGCTAGARTAIPPHGWPPPGRDHPGVLHCPRRQVGWVHAPSPTHAVTAGVLRAGELSHEDGSSISSIDLTSARVRSARDVLEAVRNGQPFGALLGYRVERALADAGAHMSVTELRRRFPQRRVEGDPGTPAGDDHVVPADVLDGLDLWQAGPATVESLGLPPGESATVTSAITELDRFVDAVADLMVAEGVHGIVTGRSEHAGATFDALAHAGQPPAELISVTEPRAGVALTHRLVLSLADPTGTEGWVTDRPRARLAPATERWAERVLGPASAWSLTADGAQTLDALGLCALDVLAEAVAVRTEAGTGGPGAAPEPPLAARIQLVTGGGSPHEDLTRLIPLAAAAAEVLAAARPATAADLNPPPASSDLDQRVVPADPPPDSQQLRPLTDALLVTLAELDAAVTALAPTGAADPIALRTCEALSIPGAMPTPSDATSVQAVAAFARSALADTDQRLHTALIGLHALSTGDPALADRFSALADRLTPGRDDPAARAEAIELIAAASPQALTTFTSIVRSLAGPATVPGIAVASSLAEHQVPVDTLLTQDPATAAVLRDPATAAEAWFDTYGRVRDAVVRYDDLRLFVDANGGRPDDVQIVQLPLSLEDGWLGAELPPSTTDNQLRQWRRPDGPRVHAVVAGTLPAEATAEALVLDDFIEVLPAETATTGVALHYDAPNARPPQAILLAVHPNPTETWSWRLLAETVTEVLDLTRLRAVDVDDLSGMVLDGVLPLTYVRRGIDNPDYARFITTFSLHTRQMLASALRQPGGTS